MSTRIYTYGKKKTPEQAEAHKLVRAEGDGPVSNNTARAYLNAIPADKTAERDQLRAELVTERARLDWLLSYDGVDWILSAHKNRKLFEGESDNRALLEAAMKEGAK